MNEEEIINNLWDLSHLNTYLDLNNEMKEKCEIPREILKRWFENSKGLLDLYKKEKEKRIIEFAKDEKGVVYLGVDFNENSTDLIISKCKDKITVGTFIPSNKANFEKITRLKFYTKKSVEAMIIRLTEIHEEFELLEEE